VPSCWSSKHPEVLAWWASLDGQVHTYHEQCRLIEQEFGDRNIVLRTGFGDDSPMGISSKSYNEEPPPGWKLGWGKRGSGFFSPRATPNKDHPKAACVRAQEAIESLQKLKITPRKDCHLRFGTPEFAFFGLHSVSPGLTLIDDELWLTFGAHDYELRTEGLSLEKPKMAEYFVARSRSSYYAARESAGFDNEED
jgi:hypothetical protein